MTGYQSARPRASDMKVARSGRSRRQMRLGTLFLRTYVALVLFFLVAPISIIVPVSFSSSQFLQFPPPGFSLQWYREIFTGPNWTDSIITSVQVGVLTSLLATTLGVLASFGIVRGDFRGKQALYTFLLSPMIVPTIILAISIYFLYARMRLVGSLLGLTLAHTVLALPLVVVIVSAALRGFDVTLERAARSLGANEWTTFFHVTFPLLRPAIVSAAFFAFLTSFDELIIALFISGTSAVTLPKRMWDGIRLEISPAISAVSVLLIAIAVVAFVAIGILQRKGAGGSDD